MRLLPWLLAVSSVLSVAGDAKFAASQGFSGKHGVDCGACHTAATVETADPVVLVLDGLPTAWDADAAYELRIRVAGGPRPNPVPGQPQAGFDLETDAGTLAAGPDMEGLLRFPGPQEATYTGAGTLRREWTIVWTAPNLTRPPVQAGFWLAGLAANGNHNMQGPEAAGELGDRHARIERSVPPSESALRRWEERPVPVPVLDPLPARVDADSKPVLVTGRVADHVDGAQWRLDAAPWEAAPGRPVFLFYLPAVAPGGHRLEVRALLGERTSDPAVHEFEFVSGSGLSTLTTTSPGSVWSPLWLLLAVGLLLLPLLLKLRR